jgi:carboxymethylenebutenolidase
MKRISILACVLPLLFACQSTDSPAPASAPKAPAAKPASTSATGHVSESEFKALHVLKQGDAPKLHGAMIDLSGSRAYLALPPNAKAPLPALVVIHEWWGLNDHVKHWADRLAAEGYAAVAVDLYGGFVATNPDDAMKAMQAVDQTKADAILLAAHKFLASDPRVKATKRGSIGWCFGGHQSLRLALAAPDLDAAVMYYGFPISDPAALEPLHADLLGIFGTRDTSIPPSAVAEFDAALKKASKRHEFHSFDAAHAFANPSNEIYDEKSAAAAWEIVRKFLADHLKPAH